jgi:hypothetical protein
MESDQLAVHCEATPVYEARYNPRDNASPVEAVAEAVAAVEGIDSMHLPPLYDHVDVEAMNRLITGGSDGLSGGVVLGFTVESWNVFVRGDGQIRIFDSEEDGEPTPAFGSVSTTSDSNRSQRPATTD